jgi:hypothetical protein
MRINYMSKYRYALIGTGINETHVMQFYAYRCECGKKCQQWHMRTITQDFSSISQSAKCRDYHATDISNRDEAIAYVKDQLESVYSSYGSQKGNPRYTQKYMHEFTDPHFRFDSVDAGDEN